jgi:hypothetical protein
VVRGIGQHLQQTVRFAPPIIANAYARSLDRKVLLLKPHTRISFHHQPEAQHPKIFNHPQAAERVSKRHMAQAERFPIWLITDIITASIAVGLAPARKALVFRIILSDRYPSIAPGFI